MTSILLNKNSAISCDDLRNQLKERKIDTRSVFPAISQYPHWPLKQAPQPNALYLSEYGINLPSGARLKKNQVEYICNSLMSILE